MQALFAPLAFGLLLFYALDPVVDAMERIRIPRWIGAAVAIVLDLRHDRRGRLHAAGRGDDRDQSAADGRTAHHRADRSRRADRESGPLDKVEQAAAELQKTDTPKPAPGVMRVQVEEPRITATSLLWSGSIGAVSALNQLIMIMFLTYFILLSDKMFRRKFVELAGPRLSNKKLTVEIIDSIAIANRPLSDGPDLHERRGGHCDVGRAALPSGSSRRRCGDCWRESSIRFRTMVH